MSPAHAGLRLVSPSPDDPSTSPRTGPGRRDRPETTALLPDPDRPGGGWVTESLQAHVDRLGPIDSRYTASPPALVELLELLGLTGRGGGHFPVATKWRAVLAAGGGGTVVANAAEGEPASAKDATLIAAVPHLVLDGLVLAAHTLGALDVVVWLHEGAHSARASLVRALDDRRAAGMADPPVRLESGPDHYLTGESSAVVAGLEGRDVLPRFTRVPAAARGVAGRPTLVANVETLARVGLAAHTGPDAFPTTSLLTISAGGRRRVVEASPDDRLGELVTQVAAPAGRRGFAAVLLGGYGGRWLDWSVARDLAVEESAARAAGASLGAGVVVALPLGTCGIAEAARLMRYLAASSAGQCGPCVFGLRDVAEMVTEIVDGHAGRGAARQVRRWAEQITGRGACHHPDGALDMLASAFEVFADDLDRHLRGRPCPASARTEVCDVPPG
ncbi:MAG: NADH-ubiquinone oxidoreductase-F iron-sulfur binding region domain-containing protein [Actinomycetes bacterium]